MVVNQCIVAFLAGIATLLCKPTNITNHAYTFIQQALIQTFVTIKMILISDSNVGMYIAEGIC